MNRIHLRRLLDALIVMCVVAVASGCVSTSPDYPVAQLEFDETLIGEWIPANADREGNADHDANPFSLVRIEPRDVEHNGQRVNPAWTLNLMGKDKPKPTMKQYRIVAIGQDERGQSRQQFEAYLIKVGSAQLLGLQLESAELEGKTYAPMFPFLLPVHFVMRLDRDGDRLQIRAPKEALVGWIPVVKPLDAPIDAASRKPLPAPGEEGAIFYAADSIDRLLDYYAALADREDAWEAEEPGMTLIRRAPLGNGGIGPR